MEDYFKGSFSFAANGTGGILVDIYDEVGPNNRQIILNANIFSNIPTLWTAETLPNKTLADGTMPYRGIPTDKRTLSKIWSPLLKAATEKSVEDNTPQPRYYIGWQKDRAEAEAAKRAREEKQNNKPKE